MTSTAEDTSKPAPFQLPIDVRVVDGPDGTHWVCFTVQDTCVSASFRIPPAPAETLANSVSGALRKAATEARRADSGLIVADVIPPGQVAGPAR